MQHLIKYREETAKFFGMAGSDLCKNLSSKKVGDVRRSAIFLAYSNNLGTASELAIVFNCTTDHVLQIVKDQRERQEEIERIVNLISRSFASSKESYIDDPRLRELINRILKTMGVRYSSIMSRQRNRETASCRFVIWFMLHEYFALSLSAIGRMFGRDHTTIMHALDAYKKRKDLQELVKFNYDEWMEGLVAEIDQLPVNIWEPSTTVSAITRTGTILTLIPQHRDISEKPSKREGKERMNKWHMRDVDYSKHEYNLPRGV